MVLAVYAGITMALLGGSQNVVATSDLIPTGVQEIYGEELGISYDGVSPNNPALADQTINVMKNLDLSLMLEGEDLDRYTRILLEISCEYCCGAKSIIFENGESACGCAHSYAMRGLAKYLILEHPDEFTDQEVLRELAKWKVLYFPGQMIAKAQVMEEQGIETTYTNLGSNAYRGIEKGVKSNGGMVGGC